MVGSHPDPRRPGKKLLGNTLVIFTSDNGAEKNSNIATGPFRSNKGSCYEGGHRVPFIAAWPAGGVGDGDATTPSQSNASIIGLTDMYATFAAMAGATLPDLAKGEKGAEDSTNVLPALQGKTLRNRSPLFFNDHKEAKADPAVAAMRVENWKLFFDASLLREGQAQPVELFDLTKDPIEEHNLIRNPKHQHLVRKLALTALRYRRVATRLAHVAPVRATLIGARRKARKPGHWPRHFISPRRAAKR